MGESVLGQLHRVLFGYKAFSAQDQNKLYLEVSVT